MMVSAEDDPRRAGTIWTHDLDQPAPVVSPLLPATFRRVGQESVSTLAALSGGDGLAEMRKRLDMGRFCYTAWVEGNLTAYGWVSFNEEIVGELDLRLHLLPGEAYLWDCFTLPAYRGQRLYSALLAYMVAELRAEKFCRAWIGADLDNLPSQRGIARAGFLHVADLVVARVLALRMVWVQAQPGVPASLVAEARRAFLGDRDRVWLDALSTVKSI